VLSKQKEFSYSRFIIKKINMQYGYFYYGLTVATGYTVQECDATKA